MMGYIPRDSEVNRGLEAMGWRRVRRQRRRHQPEIWKKRKVWPETGRELIVRIVRHNGLFRAEVVRVRTFNVYWQPLLSLHASCPLALAAALHLDGDGDPVRAAYRETKRESEEAGEERKKDWVLAPPEQMPRVGPTTGRYKYSMGVDAFLQGTSAHRQVLDPVTTPVDCDLSKPERRMSQYLQSIDDHTADALRYTLQGSATLQGIDSGGDS